MRHTLAVLVHNRSGVLARVAGLFSRRGYNIHSLSVGITEDPDISRMTIVVEGDADIIEQMSKQLHKLIDVIKISDITSDQVVARELALIKVTATSTNRSEILEVVNIFRAQIVDVHPKSLVIEVTGDADKIDAMVNMLRPYGIKEMVRTGRVAMARGT
ncbi:MAG: acetolactate synthase small subunit [Limnochordia bacterium]|nr:acetolactate synthase small subunit [Limnochordia bacterium]MDD2629712.1 acetolactate synthase small subunit [Limnochordia bacterium]MDD4517545.1 acetolactate synthase small subunit [Limnochordia bacterium]